MANVKFEKYIKDTLEAKQLKNAYDFVFSEIEDKANDLLSNQYIKTANIEMIREWEIYLEIPEDSSMSLEERKGVVLLRLFTKPPYTLPNITKQIKNIIGEDVNIFVDAQTKKLTVAMTHINTYQLKMLQIYLNGVKPANIFYEINIATEEEVNYNEYYGIAGTEATIYDIELGTTEPPIPTKTEVNYNLYTNSSTKHKITFT